CKLRIGLLPAPAPAVIACLFPCEWCKAPREQRPASILANGNHFFKPNPLVLSAWIDEMDWDHHALFQHPIDVGLAIDGRLFDIHVGQSKAMEENDRCRGIGHAVFPIDVASLGLQFADADSWPHRIEQRLGRSGCGIRELLCLALWLTFHDPSLPA